jgi:uncharacterized coiled-coil DUF342 family protein
VKLYLTTKHIRGKLTANIFHMGKSHSEERDEMKEKCNAMNNDLINASNKSVELSRTLVTMENIIQTLSNDIITSEKKLAQFETVVTNLNNRLELATTISRELEKSTIHEAR